MNAIYVLWLRQMKRYFRSRSRIVASLGQPILYLVALGFGFGPVFQRAGQGNYLQFIAPGVVGMTVLFSGIFSGIELIWDRQFGFLKEVLVAPVSRFSIMAGRTLGGATVSMFQGALVIVICLIAGFRPANLATVPFALVFMALIAVAFTAMGTAIASVLSDFQGFQFVMGFVVMPMFFLSGSIYPLTFAPKALRLAAVFDPLSYGIDGMRAALTGVGTFGVTVDLAVLSAVAAGLLIVGSWLFSRIQL